MNSQISTFDFYNNILGTLQPKRFSKFINNYWSVLYVKRRQGRVEYEQLVYKWEGCALEEKGKIGRPHPLYSCHTHTYFYKYIYTHVHIYTHTLHIHKYAYSHIHTYTYTNIRHNIDRSLHIYIFEHTSRAVSIHIKYMFNENLI